MQKLIWFGIAAGAGLLAGQITQRSLSAGWKSIGGEDPPDDASDSPLGSALLWTALLGAVTGVTRLMLMRGSAVAWERATGDGPPTD